MSSRVDFRFVAVAFGLGLAACSKSNFDSESHFVCSADGDCPGGRCVNEKCESLGDATAPAGPVGDTVDPRGAATPDCESRSCSGTLQGIYTARPPSGLSWYADLSTSPLLSVGPDGQVVLFFEQLDGSYAGSPIVRRLSPALDEVSSTVVRDPTSNAHLFIDADGMAIVDADYPNDALWRLVISTFDSAVQPRHERELVIPTGTTVAWATSAGAVSLVGSTHFLGPDSPAHPDCPELDSLVRVSPDDVLTPIRCFRGITAGGFTRSPSGFGFFAGVEGESTDHHPIDLGDGAIDAVGGAQVVARYDRNLETVWTRVIPNGSLSPGAPAPGGGLWGLANPAFPPGSEFGPPANPAYDRSDTIFVDTVGNPAFVDARTGWSASEPVVDGAGNAVSIASEIDIAGTSTHRGEIRKLRLDGSVAWTIPIVYGPTSGDAVAVGPRGEVYFATIVSAERHSFPSTTVVVGGQEFTGPMLVVMRFAP